jgi:phenylacetic acid degradation operon negative regulatory protein
VTGQHDARPGGERPAAGGQQLTPARGPSARAYLLFVLGDYVLSETSPGAWTQTLLDALALVGFEERAARQALTRSAAAGWLISQRSGRRARWQLTPAGRDYIGAAKRRVFAPGPERDWNGDWLVVLTTLPENNRPLRHRLRSALGWAGFGSPSPGVWISPHPSHAKEARDVLASLGNDVRATILHAQLDDPAERHRLVAQAWDVAELDARYHAFMDTLAAVNPVTPADAFAARLHLLYRWRRLLLADPGLPPMLLPLDWSGEQARRLMVDRYVAWQRLATEWWDTHQVD